jgi:hypothetical protein
MKFIASILPIKGIPNLVFLFLLLLCNASSQSHAQSQAHTLSGRVIDHETLEPLAFVNLVIEGTRSGTMTDIDGIFSISHHSEIKKLALSYIGYKNIVFDVPAGKSTVLIPLQREAIELPLVMVFPGENPAHRIIRNTIENRQCHNPFELTSFSFISYNKFIFTGEMEDKSTSPAPPAADTLAARLGRHLEDHHFLIMETINQRKFIAPNRNNETILASRVSGLENPTLALMASQFQAFSFYDDYITISGGQYLSPISPGSINRYSFLLQDTTFINNDSIFIISYQPGRGRNFNGLTGLLYINSNGWAVQNVIAEPFPQSADTRIRIQQKYQLINNKYWFPSQLLTDVEFLGVNIPAEFKIMGHGRTYISNVDIGPDLKRRDLSPFNIEFSPESIVRDESFWNEFRADTLTSRERNTYHRMDSLGRARNLDNILEGIDAILSGYYRKGIFDYDIFSLFGHNEVEGVRLGLGLRTNHRFSRRVSVNGHFAYGFTDDKTKYGFGGNYLLFRRNSIMIGARYEFERHEKGRTIIRQAMGLFDPFALRAFFLRDLDMVDLRMFWIGWRMMNNSMGVQLLAQKDVRWIDDYIFDPGSTNNKSFSRTFNAMETGISLHHAPGRMFVSTPLRIYDFGNGYPHYFLTMIKGWDGLAGGSFDYWKAEAMMIQSYRIRLIGSQRWVVHAGFASGDLPWHKLFNAPAAYRKFSIAIPQHFSTMRMDEFFSDQYINIFFQHNFHSLLFRRPGFAPQLVIQTNAGLGRLSDAQPHRNVTLGSYPKAYLESGFAILDLMGSGLSGVGIEFMYRYGPYGFPTFADNFSLRLSYSMLF